MTEPSYLNDVRSGYDAIAAEYAEMFRDQLAGDAYARAIHTAFAERVTGRVLEVGSGPGRTTAALRALGCDISGVDLSPEMVALASRTFPDIRFEEGSMTALDVPDGTLGGLVSWYSLIHIRPADHPAVIAEFHRVLRPGGRLLLGFQVGTEPLRLENPFGHPVTLDFHRLSPDRTADLLADAGFDIEARLVRAPEGREAVPQAYLVAVRPDA
ncbi:class I SAM-dependent DNA methyltransferase [Actinomadura atramentaria]|uniref:class I SAM-dependent DNA methyltransferase n=1 Tax=Actinomadura atramentaria TaxID=1990 RepID=UPI000371CE34|nr:class I SAM-dependent methyltransferase [Actinomadura atramentaria]